MVGLQAACFPTPFPQDLLWKREHIERHLAAFPEGQLVCELDGQIVGSASSLVIPEARWQAHLSWEETTGGYFFDGHDPEGTTLFGADISVHPSFRGRGIGWALYRARFELVVELGLWRYGTACRIPGWREWAAGLNEGDSSQERYCEAVVKGETSDRTLSALLRYGLSFVGVVHGHMNDAESGDAAAVLEWAP